MARVKYVKKAQQRFKTVPVLNPDGTQKVTPVLRKDGTPKLTKSGRPVVRRITIEDPNQPLPNRQCCKCGTEIEVGMPYKWFATKSTYGGSKKVFCTNCQIRPSDQTSSYHLQTLYGAIETAEDTLEGLSTDSTLDDVAQVLTDCADGVQEVVDSYTESADNMEEGFGHETYQSQEIREKAEQLEQFVSELQDAASEIESLDDWNDEDEIKGQYAGDLDENDEPEDADDFAEFVDTTKSERFDEAVSRAQDALGGSPL